MAQHMARQGEAPNRFVPKFHFTIGGAKPKAEPEVKKSKKAKAKTEDEAKKVKKAKAEAKKAEAEAKKAKAEVKKAKAKAEDEAKKAEKAKAEAKKAKTKTEAVAEVTPLDPDKFVGNLTSLVTFMATGAADEGMLALADNAKQADDKRSGALLKRLRQVLVADDGTCYQNATIVPDGAATTATIVEVRMKGGKPIVKKGIVSVVRDDEGKPLTVTPSDATKATKKGYIYQW